MSFKDGLLELFKELQKEGLTFQNSQEEQSSNDRFLKDGNPKNKESSLEEEIQGSSLGFRRMNSKSNLEGK